MGIEAYPPVNSSASSYLTESAFQWVSFTPTWVVTGTAPTNYTIAGKYLKVGSLCHISMYVAMGASFTHGSSTLWMLQTPAGVPTPISPGANGIVYFYDATGGAYFGQVRCGTASAYWTMLTSTTSATPAYNVPFTWAANDYFMASATYEVAP